MKELNLYNGDCLDELKKLDDNSIDSIVTDPPYGLSFMGKKWDYDVPSVEIWKECLRVLKPGGHLLAFAGSRTYHRMAVRIEDAGFDIRDQIMWIYGSGFPKSHKLGDGWGTALKPAHEPIVMARKSFKGSCKDNHKEYGVGGLNIDATRIGNEVRTTPIHSTDVKDDTTLFGLHPTIQHHREETTMGRWPANVILDEEAGMILDKQSGNRKGWQDQKHNSFNPYGGNALHESNTERDGLHKGYNDEGGASRFFYCPKANAKDRDSGIQTDAKALRATKGGARDFNARCASCGKKFIGSPDTICSCDNPITDNQVFKRKNNHPTVKPTELMKYLIRLVTPKGGTTLDPFMGSGSTGKAAIQEGMQFVGIEREKEYYEIAKQRIQYEMDKRRFW